MIFTILVCIIIAILGVIGWFAWVMDYEQRIREEQGDF